MVSASALSPQCEIRERFATNPTFACTISALVNSKGLPSEAWCEILEYEFRFPWKHLKVIGPSVAYTDNFCFHLG